MSFVHMLELMVAALFATVGLLMAVMAWATGKLMLVVARHTGDPDD